MQRSNAKQSMAGQDSTKRIILELTVNNHPGVMSHICNLFSRRAYNLEKILCFPKPESSESRMWLQVNEENRLDQIIKQIEKLEDVIDVQSNQSSSFFSQLEAYVTSDVTLPEERLQKDIQNKYN